MTFKIKRQVVPILLMNIIFIALLVLLFLIMERDKIFLYLFISTLVIYALYLFSLLSSSCSIKKNYLYYRSGIFFYRINLDEIIRIETCKNLYASLSPAIDRIRIVYNVRNGQKMKYIAVEDNENLIQFIKHKVYEKL